MPGPAFHFEVLRLAIEALRAGPADDQAKAQVMIDHPNHARLGALGPDLLRYRPVATQALDTLVQTPDLANLSQADRIALIKQIQPNPEMAVYGMLYRVLVPHYAELLEIDDFLREMADIAAAEDINRLKTVKDTLDQIKPKIDALKGLVDQAKGAATAGQIAIAVGKPTIEGDAPALTPAWRPFEFLRWKRTAEFGRSLLDQANAKNDDQLRAYAYGYLSHIAAAVTGEPFVNSIVGGPYRTHWWRNKWVRNYVDGWTFGRYATPATMSFDTPTPAYADWRSLCGADLQDQFKVDAGLAGADAATAVQSGSMPPTPEFDKIGNALLAAVTQTFGPGGSGPAIPHPAALDNLAAFQAAYVGAVSVMWFMTGSHPVAALPPGAPPAGAETPPAWFTGGGAPPSPSGGGGSSTASTVSGVIAAILAVIAVVTGAAVVGIAAAIFAVASLLTAADAGQPLDWTMLRGTIYWLQVTIFQIEDAVHKTLLKAGVAYPLGRELGTEPSGVFPWLPASDDTMVALTKSRRVPEYPLRMYEDTVAGQNVPADGLFAKSPGSEPERPSTRETFQFLVYPSVVIDGLGVLNGGVVTDNGVFPTRDQDFGGAVGNAVEVIRGDAATLVNYNLDGDRGYGWKTWRPKLGTKPGDASTEIAAVEEP